MRGTIRRIPSAPGPMAWSIIYLFPNWRVKADLQSLYDLKNYEALTCVAGEGKFRGKETQIGPRRGGSSALFLEGGRGPA